MAGVARWQRPLDLTEISVGAVVVGALGGMAAVLMHGLLRLVTNLLYYQRVSFQAAAPMDHQMGLAAVLVPVGGGLLVAILLRVLPGARESSGTTEVIAAVSAGATATRTAPTLSHLAIAAVTLGSGGSAGREGPIVDAGAMAGRWVGWWRGFSPRERRVLMACGAAGALAATFNAPLAAVAFVLEVILLEFRVLSFVPLVISSAVGTTVGRLALGDHPAFEYPDGLFGNEGLVGLLFYTFLGIACAGVGLALLHLFRSVDAFAFPVWWPGWFTPVFAGLLLGIVGFAEPRLLGVGYETVNDIFQDQLGSIEASLAILLGLFLLKPVALAITLRGGGAGGAFSPALFMGAVVGALFGHAAHAMAPTLGLEPIAFALVGMVAVFAAVSRAALTSILLAMEMSSSLAVVVPAMMACVVANLLSWARHPGSIYTAKLEARGRTIALELEPNALDLMLVRDVMDPTPAKLPEKASVKDLVDKVMETGRTSFPVVDEQGHLVGVVSRSDLKDKTVDASSLERPISSIMTGEVLVSYPDETVHVAISKMLGHGVSQLPVVRRDDPKSLVGWMTADEAIKVHKPR